MFQTSAEYRKAMLLNQRTTRVGGIIGGDITIGDNDIVQGSLSISHQCVDSTDLNLGSVFASEMIVSIFYDKEDYQKLIGKLIQLYFGVLDENDVWQNIPLGVYEIAEATRGKNIVKLRANDNMMHFDTFFVQPDTQSRTPYGWLVDACDKCGITFGMTEEEMSELPNFQAYSMNGFEGVYTYRDIVSFIATISGCFAYIDRTGALKLKQITKSDSVITIPKRLRKSTEISDLDIKFVAVTMQKGENTYGAINEGDGRMLSIGDMPLLEDYNGEQSTYENACMNILKGLSSVRYSPFTVKWVGDPALEVGDFVTFEDVNGENITSLLTHHTWIFRGNTTLKGVGEKETAPNPNSKTPSQNTKEILGLKVNMQNYATKDDVNNAVGMYATNTIHFTETMSGFDLTIAGGVNHFLVEKDELGRIIKITNQTLNYVVWEGTYLE